MTWNQVVHSIEGSLGCPLYGMQTILCKVKAIGVARRPLYLFQILPTPGLEERKTRMGSPNRLTELSAPGVRGNRAAGGAMLLL